LTVTVIVGELDLSIGFAASWAGVLVTGLMVHAGLPPWLAILAVLASGAVIGAINGLVVTKLRVNSVIATLGTGTIIVGLNFAYTTGAPIASGVPFSFVNIALGRMFGVPNDILIMIAVLVALWILVNRTELGQSIQAIGGNAEAARLSGIRVDRVKILAYVMSGLTAALTGILLASLLGSGTTSAADSYLLTAFAAVFLGSATLRDGEFHILGTFIAVLIISIGFNGLAIFGAPTFYQYLFQGIILIAAVALSSLGRVYAGR
jgi:ribose transport system permease protein